MERERTSFIASLILCERLTYSERFPSIEYQVHREHPYVPLSFLSSCSVELMSAVSSVWNPRRGNKYDCDQRDLGVVWGYILVSAFSFTFAWVEAEMCFGRSPNVVFDALRLY